MVHAIQLGEKSDEGVLLSDCNFAGVWRIGMSWMPTLKSGRRRSGGMLSTGKRGSREAGTEERMERS